MSNDEIRILINDALSFGYHTAKDEAKGIPSSGYGTRFFDMHNLEQKLDIASVSSRRELLFAFIKEVNDEFPEENWDYLDFIAERMLGK